jgi:hypothetical protein
VSSGQRKGKQCKPTLQEIDEVSKVDNIGHPLPSAGEFQSQRARQQSVSVSADSEPLACSKQLEKKITRSVGGFAPTRRRRCDQLRFPIHLAECASSFVGHHFRQQPTKIGGLLGRHAAMLIGYPESLIGETWLESFLVELAFYPDEGSGAFVVVDDEAIDVVISSSTL